MVYILKPTVETLPASTIAPLDVVKLACTFQTVQRIEPLHPPFLLFITPAGARYLVNQYNTTIKELEQWTH